jgi:regulator of sigma E protease
VGQLGNIIAIGLAFGVTVFVHEAGHFLAARLSGMAVHEFSIGFGRPLLFWVKRGDTQYSFRLWPFFSYVRVAGMDPGDEHPRGFNKKSRAAQAFVLVVGCVMNFLLGAAIFIVIGAVLGRPVAVTRTIDRVLAGEPAAKAGIRAGDTLVGVGKQTGLSLDDIQQAIQTSAGKPIVIDVERAGRLMSFAATPRKVSVQQMLVTSGTAKGAIESKFVEAPKTAAAMKRVREGSSAEKGMRAGTPGTATKSGAFVKRGETKIVVAYRDVGRIGVVFRLEVARMGIWRSVAAGFRETFAMVRMLVDYLAAAITGRAQLVLQGPVGVVHTLYEEAQTGWRSFLSTAAALTVGIGFLNLLPIPPLDGSRIVITAIEAIRRKPIDKRKENLIHLIGFALLLTLVAVLTYKDILSIVRMGGG